MLRLLEHYQCQLAVQVFLSAGVDTEAVYDVLNWTHLQFSFKLLPFFCGLLCFLCGDSLHHLSTEYRLLGGLLLPLSISMRDRKLDDVFSALRHHAIQVVDRPVLHCHHPRCVEANCCIQSLLYQYAQKTSPLLPQLVVGAGRSSFFRQ